VLAGADPARSLGPALALARSIAPAPTDPASWPVVNVLADAQAGTLARQAGQFAHPPAVWSVSGRTLAPAGPEPLPVALALDPRVAGLADLLIAAGADPVVEHGRLIGEVLGLEVARVEVDEQGAHLAIGVGRFDREGHAVVSADLDPAETLERVVALVRRHRQPGAEPHPLGRLAAARGLRARVVAMPSLVGADHLATYPTVAEAPDLRTPWPAPAVGLDADGRPLVVVCSVGIDLDLVPAAADVRLSVGLDHELVLVVSARDAHPVTLALAAALAQPARVVVLEPEGRWS
jgi:hypothetical protein